MPANYLIHQSLKSIISKQITAIYLIHLLFLKAIASSALLRYRVQQSSLDKHCFRVCGVFTTYNSHGVVKCKKTCHAAHVYKE